MKFLIFLTGLKINTIDKTKKMVWGDDHYNCDGDQVVVVYKYYVIRIVLHNHSIFLTISSTKTPPPLPVSITNKTANVVGHCLICAASIREVDKTSRVFSVLLKLNRIISNKCKDGISCVIDKQAALYTAGINCVDIVDILLSILVLVLVLIVAVTVEETQHESQCESPKILLSSLSLSDVKKSKKNEKDNKNKKQKDKQKQKQKQQHKKQKKKWVMKQMHMMHHLVQMVGIVMVMVMKQMEMEKNQLQNMVNIVINLLHVYQEMEHFKQDMGKSRQGIHIQIVFNEAKFEEWEERQLRKQEIPIPTIVGSRKDSKHLQIGIDYPRKNISSVLQNI